MTAPFPKPCGRLDRHEHHTWTRPATLDILGGPLPARDYTCTGRALIEGGYWADWDAEDDAREHELDRQIRDGLAAGWTGDAA